LRAPPTVVTIDIDGPTTPRGRGRSVQGGHAGEARVVLQHDALAALAALDCISRKQISVDAGIDFPPRR